MKTLSFQQPWAQLIASGIKEVENRTWATKYRGKILIHASSKKVTDSWYKKTFIEWAQETSNHQYFGNIPFDDQLPTSAIIGYVEVVDCEEGETDGFWDGFPEDIKWRLKDAYLFDEPILDVKGKLNLFEYDLDESNLPPAHKVNLSFPHIEGTTLFIPVDEGTIEEAPELEDFYFCINPTMSFFPQIIPDIENGEIAKIESVCLECNGKKVTRKVAESYIFLDVDKNGDPRKGYSLFSAEQQVYRNLCLVFE